MAQALGKIEAGEGGGLHPAIDRLLSALLVELDGITSGSGSNVSRKSRDYVEPLIVIATAQTKAALDSALLRPGRLEEHIELTFPNREQCCRFFSTELAAIPLFAGTCDEEKGMKSFSDLAASLADRSCGRSFASLHLLIQEAKQEALKACVQHGAFDVSLARNRFLAHLV